MHLGECIAQDIKLHNFMAIAFLKQHACYVAYTRLAKQNEALPLSLRLRLRLRLTLTVTWRRDVDVNSLVSSWQALHVPRRHIKVPQTNADEMRINFAFICNAKSQSQQQQPKSVEQKQI